MLKKELKKITTLKKVLKKGDKLFLSTQKSTHKINKKNSVKKSTQKSSSKQKSTQKSILDFLWNAQKSELYLSLLTNIDGDIIPWLVS